MSQPQLIIGNKNYSSWSLRPWLVLKHLAVDFDELRVPLFTETFKQQIRQYSQAGKVPVLISGDTTIWDSLAICEYLAEQHPQLWPDSASDRALARSAVAEMHSGFMALRAELPMNCRARQRSIDYSAAAAADIARLQALWQQCQQQSQPSQSQSSQSLSSQSPQQGPWLFGRFGIIDAFFAPIAIRFNAYQVPLTSPAQAYINTQLANPDLQLWISQGCAEAEVLEEEEAGEV